MKTCVLISGQPRKVYELHEHLKECLINPNNADVFIHTWGDEDDLLFKFINDTFQPISMVVEKPHTLVNDNLDVDVMLRTHAIYYNRSSWIDMLYNSWYSSLQSNLLKEKYRLINNIKYDYVIRARFDMMYNQPLNVSMYDPNFLNLNNRSNIPHEMIDDRFAFGSNEIMNLYTSGFCLFEKIHSNRKKIDEIFCGETIVYEIMKTFNIPINIIPDLKINKLI